MCMEIPSCRSISLGSHVLPVPHTIGFSRGFDDHAIHLAIVHDVVQNKVPLLVGRELAVGLDHSQPFAGGRDGEADAAIRLFLVDEICGFHLRDLLEFWIWVESQIPEITGYLAI